MWNKKQRSFAKLPASVAMVRYEDLVQDPEQVLNTIRGTFQVRTKPQFVNYMTSTKEKGRKDFEYYKTFYTEERWRTRYNHLPTLNFISATLDDEMMEVWRYAKWTPVPGVFNHDSESWMVTPPKPKSKTEPEVRAVKEAAGVVVVKKRL